MTASQKSLIWRTFFALLILAVYWHTLGNRFVWDDLDVIVKNPLLQSLGNLPRLLLYEDRTGECATGYYRPLTYLTFLLDRSVWGLNPLGFNISNIILHITVSLLFCSVLTNLFKSEKLAYVATLIFALHPVASEAVNFHAGGRNTLLCAALILLTLLCYIKRRAIPALLCFIAAIFSKEFALLLPLIFFLYDRYLAKEKRSWSSYLPYAISIVCYLTIRSFAVTTRGNLLKTFQFSGILMTPQIVVSYLKNMLFPLNLKIIYNLQPSIDAVSIGLCSLLVAAVLAAAFVFRKRGEVAAAACWFFLFLIPVSGILPLGSALIADRYAYLSLMGFSLALAYLLCKLNVRVVAAVLVPVCVCYVLVDLQRESLWKDMPSLYLQMTKDAPEKSIGFTNLGMYYYETGDLANAEKYLEQSCSKNGIVIHDAYQYLSAVYWEENQYDKALSVLKKLMEIEPENPQSYIMASKIYQSKGDAANAKLYHDKVEAMFPGIDAMMQQRVAALCREAEKLMAEHKPAEAERKLKEALMMNPAFVPALVDMGSLVAERGDHAKALVHFAKAESLDPGNGSIHYNLAMVYDLMGRKGEAQQEMEKFNQLEARGKGK
jgi:protein O-mannosyl-transferase